MKEDIKQLMAIHEDLANLACKDSIYNNDEYKQNIVKALSEINTTIEKLKIDLLLKNN